MEDKDNAGSGKTSRVEYTYDSYGNVTKEVNSGDIDASSDESTVYRYFKVSTSANILNKPARERVYSGTQSSDDGGSAMVRETRYVYDSNNTFDAEPTKGNLKALEQKSGTSTYVTTSYTYDSYGNRLTEVDPNTKTTTWTYETTHNTYPATKTYPVSGLDETYTYDAGTTNLLSVVAVNDQTTSYSYDTFKRLTQVDKPLDEGWTTKIFYNNWGTSNSQNVETRTWISGMGGNETYLWSKNFFDGLGRVVQTHAKGETGHTIIGSTTTFNNRGLTDKQYVSQDYSASVTTYQLPETSWKYASYEYDALGRVTTQNNADGSHMHHSFSNPWQDQVTNELGKKKNYFFDAFKRLMKVQELDGSDALYADTDYTYDVLGNLTQVRATGTNPIANSDFEYGTSGWTPYLTYNTVSSETSIAKIGAKSMKVASTGVWGRAEYSISNYTYYRNKSVTFAAWCYRPSTGQDKTARLYLYYKAPGQGGECGSVNIPSNGAWHWMTVTASIPSDADRLVPCVFVNFSGDSDNDDVVYIDGAILVEGTTVPVSPAIIGNSDFESGTTGWTTVSSTLTSETSTVKVGAKSMKVTANGTWSRGEYYVTDYTRYRSKNVTFGAWCYRPSSGQDKTAKLYIYAKATGAEWGSSVIPCDGAWHWITMTVTIPSDADRLVPCIFVNLSGTSDTDDVVYIDGATLYEEMSSPILPVTTMTYDWLSRKTAMNDPDMGYWTYGYDSNGNLTSQKDYSGQTITMTYDEMNRLTAKSGTGLSTSYSYDSTTGSNYGKGKRTGMSDSLGSTAYKYDTRGRLVEEKRTIDSTDYTTSFTYDGADRIATVVYPNPGGTGETVTYGYNGRGLPYTVSGSVVGNLATSTLYNGLGLPTEINLNNGLRTSFGYYQTGGTYDTTGGYYGRLWKIKTYPSGGGTALQEVTHTWDEGGNLTQRTDVLASQTETFTYDFLDRLTRGQLTGVYDESYTYNQIGNMTSKGGSSYTYGGTKPHAVTTAGSTSYTYDSNGNMTARGSHTLTWNLENQLASYNDGSTTTSFVYDGDGKRGKKTVSSTTLYVNKYYEKTGSEVTTYYYLGDRLVAMKKGSDLRYIHQDHLTGTALTTNSSGGQAGTTMKYYPYGSARSGSVPTDRKFTGQRLDDSTNLYFYNARYYDTGLGRFVSPDTIVQSFANPQTLNRFSYVLNNPLKYVDPTGKTVEGFSDIADLEAAMALGIMDGNGQASVEAFLSFYSQNSGEGYGMLKSPDRYSNFTLFSKEDFVYGYLPGPFNNAGALIGSGSVRISGWSAQKNSELTGKVSIVSSYVSEMGIKASTINYQVYAKTASGTSQIKLKTSNALVTPGTRAIEGRIAVNNISPKSQALLTVEASIAIDLPAPDQLPRGPSRPDKWQADLRTGKFL